MADLKRIWRTPVHVESFGLFVIYTFGLIFWTSLIWVCWYA